MFSNTLYNNIINNDNNIKLNRYDRLIFHEQFTEHMFRGFAKKKNPIIRDYYGNGWVGPGLTRIFFWKIVLNIPKPCWSSIPCVPLCMLSTLLKVVGYCDLSVLSMSVMGFQKKVWMEVGWVGGWGELYPFFCGDFLIFFNFANPLIALSHVECR